MSTAKATPTTTDRGTADWNQRNYDRFTLSKTQISQFAGFPADIQIKVCKVSAPYYGPNNNNFQANCTGPYLFFVFVFFLNAGGEIMLNVLFNTLLTITLHNTQKRRRRKERTTYGPLTRYSRLVTRPVRNPDRQGLT